MTEVTEKREKRCPVCRKEYPEEDNYCGDDGSILEPLRATTGNHVSLSPDADNTGMNAEPNSAVQH